MDLLIVISIMAWAGLVGHHEGKKECAKNVVKCEKEVGVKK